MIEKTDNHQNKKPALVFWRDVPMDVNLGSFGFVAKNWGADIIVVSFHDFSSERKDCGFEYETLDNVQDIRLANVEDKEDIVFDIFYKYPEAIHIFNGVRGELGKVLDKYIKASTNPKVLIISERPNVNNGKGILKQIKSIGRYILYRFLFIKYHKRVKCFLAMGGAGVKAYEPYGWDKNLLYDYMYCPLLPEIDLNLDKEKDLGKVKFLYIGRFDKEFKGVDLLMHAVEELKDYDNFSIDFVGGYGNDREEVLKWIEKTPQANFAGAWNSSEVCEKMLGYDVCIVPSKYDGWNLTPNQAINSGVGTIITDMAGSDELIASSNAGEVVRANDVEALTNAMKKVLADKSILSSWKLNAKAYRDKISACSVGKYFIDIINYEFLDIGDKPICPWR